DLSDGQEMLAMLEQKNLFLVPLDSQRIWYRYHHLFADVLRLFAQRLFPERIAELHRRASSWYEQHGLAREAIEHAIAARDVERTADLIEQLADSTIWAYGEMTTVQRWLGSLPEQVIHARPQLCILKAWMLQYLLGYKAVEHSSAQAIYEEAEACLHDAQRLLALDNTHPGNQAMCGEAAALFSLLFFSRNELERVSASARLALELLPQENRTLRCLAARMLFNLYGFCGDTSGIELAMQELALISRTAEDVFSRFNALLSMASYQAIRGELKQAAASHREALQYVEKLKMVSIASPHSIALSSILLEWNDLSGAEQHLLQGIEHLKKRGDPYVLVEGYYLLASLHQAQDDYEGISTALEEEQQVIYTFQQYPLNTFMRTLEAQRAWLSLLKGDVLTAIHWADNYKTSAEQHFLSQYVELTILVRVYLAMHKNEEALQIVVQQLSKAERMHHVHQSIQLLSLQALALSAQGNKAQALKTLARALALAEPGGYIRTFINEGAPMATLLLHVFEAVQDGVIPLGSNVSLHYVHTLLTASGISPASLAGNGQKQRFTALPKLSERESELLRLMALGYSDRDIARHLVLAESTIKTYARRLYTKLGVKNRTQAVTRALALHLL
ncbi:MAG TPA: LuxR C-terminal-related transcriptional regulator, partial [Ktedonobacteraceae bacterium]|nr:LuxR C-terminal-related transcriptional regulator [Ktedonobacteraceae bacterium]